MTISTYWWEIGYHPFPSQNTEATEVAKLQPSDYSIFETLAVAEQDRIPLACIAPLALVHPLLTVPCLSPAAAYTLIPTRATAWR